MDTTLDTCGCCVGIEQLTPTVIANRPGLSELAYRTGIHATFLETMLARLSTMSLSTSELDTLLFDTTVKEALIYPLSGLTTRSTDDPAIALLDAWAVVADVLTFYQERIANEGYLRTATERRSILELANLVGYTLRPGVASSVYLSFTLNDSQVSTTIPAGTRAQSLPGPGQMPQPFETSVDIEARAAWNAMKPKLSVAQYITQVELPNLISTTPPTILSIENIYTSTADGALYLKGTSTNLKAHDPVLFVFTINPGEQVFGQVLAVDPHQAEQYTRVTFPPEFTPLTFYNKLRDVLTLYQNADLFAISGGDTLVKNIVGELQNLFQQVLQAEPSSTDSFIDSDLSGNFFNDLNGLCYLYQKSVNASPPLDNNSFPTVSGLENLLGIAPGTYSNYGNDLSQLVNIVDNLFTTASTPRTRLAAWMGGVINDIKDIVLPVDKEFVTVCTPQVTTSLASLFGPLAKPPSLPPVNSTRLNRDINQIFARKGDIAPQLISTLNSAVGQNIYQALASANVTGDPDPSVAHPSLDTFYALRVKAAPFGNSVPRRPVTAKTTVASAEFAELKPGEPPDTLPTIDDTEGIGDVIGEIGITGSTDVISTTYYEWPLADADKSTNVLYLDARYDQIVPGSWVVIKYVSPTSDPTDGVSKPLDGIKIVPLQAQRVKQVDTLARTDYGLSIKVTKLTFDDGISWATIAANALLTAFRGVSVYAQSEKLEIAEEPVLDDISGDQIELGDLFDGLQSGRWAVVSGERTDIPNTSGIKTSELVMLASVEQSVRAVEVPPKPSQGGGGGGSTPPPTPTTDETPITIPSTPTDTTVHIPLPGDKTHTILHFAQSLQYTYKRDTVAVAANVAHATHGETRVEVLGSGDGSKATQQFQLRQSPLTYISSPSISGADSTLEVRVNDLLWHETDTLADKGPKDRVYITKTDDQDKTTVVFGGARLSTGVENIKAKYRTGIGNSGNMDDGQISQLASRPLGVKGVINPKAATGGADRESRDQGRRNAPLGVIALDRLVSVQDYADFARTYAGIGKASAAWLSDGRRQLVHLTVAGSDNIPIDPTSDLFRNLFLSLRLYGNPSEPLQLALCEVKLLVISARVLVLSDYKLELVAPNIRTALNEAFSFEQRDLGQPVYQSEVLSIIQDVPGVAYVDLDIMDAVDQANLLAALDQIHLEELHEAATGQKPNITEDLVKLMKLKSQPFVAAELARRNSRNKGGDGAILPAQLVFLSPDVPDTLIIRDLATSSAVQSNRRRQARVQGGRR